VSECKLGAGLLRGKWVKCMTVSTLPNLHSSLEPRRTGGIEPHIIATLRRAILCTCLQSLVKRSFGGGGE